MNSSHLWLCHAVVQTRDEIAELERDINGLEEDMQAKTAPLKLVHTRLENRTKRPGMDLCRDEVTSKTSETIFKSITLNVNLNLLPFIIQ